MSNDERPETLAAQAAAWVPPWERQKPAPDRAFQASASADDRPDDDEDRSGAGLSDDDDDFDPAFEGPNPPGYERDDREVPPPAEEPAATVDAPVELPGEEPADPTDLGLGADVRLPEPIEEAADRDGDDGGDPVDAPLPPEGDDAGDVFDQAADDDVSDDSDVDLPFAEEVPADYASDDDDDDELTDEQAAAIVADDADADDEDDASGADDDDEDDIDDADAFSDDEAAALTAGDYKSSASGNADKSAGDDTRAGGDLEGVADEAYRAGAADVAAAFGGRSETTVPRQGTTGSVPDDASARPSPRTEDDIDLPDLVGDDELAGALEAIMLVVDEPVAEMQLAQILEQPTERVAAMLEDLSARYTAAGHGFDLRRAAGGWRLYTRPEYAAYVERFVLDGQSVRLTQAALETLAVVAYKQPVTRSRISAIRGVNCDGVMRTLATRGLIEECGTESETGAYLYRTTALFLEKLGLNSVDQLPPLAPFLPDDVEEVLDATG